MVKDADKWRRKNDSLAYRSLSRSYCKTHVGLFPGCKKPNKKVVHQEEGDVKKKKMRKEKPMIFLRWCKVKVVAAEQTSVGRNLRSISKQGPSNLAEQTKRWPPWVIFHKKEVGGGSSGGRRRWARWRESLIDPLSVAPSNGDASVAIASIISLRFLTTVCAAPRIDLSNLATIALQRISSNPSFHRVIFRKS